MDRVVAAAADGTENIRRALSAFPGARRLVFLTSDLPFIDAGQLAVFVERSTRYALSMALASPDAYTAEFPGAPPHIVDLGRERFANGSAFIIDREAVAPLGQFAGRFFEARKSLPRLALLLGPLLCARYALRRLCVADIEARAQRVLGVAVGAIRDAGPGLCYDIDDVADWVYADSRCAAER